VHWSREGVGFLQNSASFRVFALRGVLVADYDHELNAGCVIVSTLSCEDVLSTPEQLVDREWLA
jgi:hypothetical protein